MEAERKAALQRMNRHPKLSTAAPRSLAQPVPSRGTGTFKPLSAPTVTAPRASPSSFSLFRKSSPPGGGFTPTSGTQANPSDVDEPSVSNNGSFVVYTGNWYQSESADSGATWTYHDPYTAFPAVNGGFCCDQHTIYSPDQNITIWQLLYSPDRTTGANTLRLAVADGQTDLQSGSWHTFDIQSGSFPYGTTGWIDYPQLALTNTNLIVTFNEFLGVGSDPGCYNAGTVCNQLHSFVSRIPLVGLAGTAPLSFSTFDSPCGSDCVDTLTPVQRGGPKTYFAGHAGSTTMPNAVPDVSTLRVYEWADSAGQPVRHDVSDPTGFVYMNGGDGDCTPPGGGINICLRDDSRVKTGWLGSGQLGFLWDAKQGTFGQTSAPYPYLRGAVIDIANNSWSLTGKISQGFSDTAAIYPDVAINPRGALGLTMTVGGGRYLPTSVLGINDEFSPPGQFELQTLEVSSSDPPFSEWGDFLAIRPASGIANSWVATGYSMQNGGIVPVFAWFGRQQDDPFAPQSLACGPPITTTMGAETTVRPLASFSGPSNWLGDYTATVDWGDGSPVSTAALHGPPATATAFGNHAFASAGSLTVTVSISDATGASESCRLAATVAGSVYTAVSRQQYQLTNNNGITWTDLDGAQLILHVTPGVTGTAIVSGNVDLWTANAGYNQDVGLGVNSGSGEQVVAWKESGGNAGTFSPNAAYVQAAVDVTAGTSYTIKLKWKTNRPDPGTIYAGAGPSAPFSPTRLTVRLVPAATPVVPVTSTTQYRMLGSDGFSWTDIDSSTLTIPYTPGVSGTAVLGGNADLWTETAGVNQDLGIFVNSGNGSGDQMVAWKESGGFAGIFSPNAAFVQASYQMTAGLTYKVKLKWKANKATAGAIRVGAGPARPFSPTSLTLEFVPSGTGVADRVTNQQYILTGSDGQTWVNLDRAGLSATVPASAGANCVGLVSGNADLWTQGAGYNQDLAIFSGPNLEAWKESGGFAGTFSPNAAFVETVVAIPSGSSPSFALKWKANQNAPNVSIRAAAGPAAPFSPNRLTVQVICS